MDTKQKALAVYLDCKPEDLERASYDESLFEYGLESYLVLDNDEVDQFVKDRVIESLWAFNIDFILPRSRITVHDYNKDSIIKALKKMQEKLCEDANPIIYALIENKDEFTKDAIKADGRGHFLSSYDNKEHEITLAEELFYIYRQN